MQLKYKSFTEMSYFFSRFTGLRRDRSRPPQQRHSHIFALMSLVKKFKSLLHLGAKKRQSKLHRILFAAGCGGIGPDRRVFDPSAHRQPCGR